MALKDFCSCCSLLVATSVAGIYALVAYVIAIVLEIWWMIQDKSEVPAGAYLLCFGHFVTIVLSGLLIVGIALKQTQWLLVWAASVGTWLIPEAALALFMSFNHWKIETPEGTTEFLFWVIRASFNIVSVACTASQYAIWTEEKIIIRRLQILNMQEAAIRKATDQAGVPAKSGHSNPGFIHASSEQVNKVPLAAIQSIGTNSRRASTTNLANAGVSLQEQSRPHPSSIPSNLHFISCYEKTMSRVAGLSSNEFNASMFMRQSPNNVVLQRARSLFEMQIQNNNVWGYFPSPMNQAPMCPGYLDTAPEASTQSLDRRQIKSQMRLQQHVRAPPYGHHYGTLPRSFRMQRTMSNGSLQGSNYSSHTSLGSQQSDQRYKDIAL
ncbi:uncharacterized protein LOC132193531 isoform X2 [Neocloeon triangulifer]|uniref:uncharacterized protein LOC132193531 isoform X2 n=1 Tax=Neocloeon triangulifer TaxID=2078957 RepID=UPI00286F6C58|nr:uncharacterized protein LOC132193531 isoform X2 [Neocloeon triangulifer]